MPLQRTGSSVSQNFIPIQGWPSYHWSGNAPYHWSGNEVNFSAFKNLESSQKLCSFKNKVSCIVSRLPLAPMFWILHCNSTDRSYWYAVVYISTSGPLPKPHSYLRCLVDTSVDSASACTDSWSHSWAACRQLAYGLPQLLPCYSTQFNL